MNKMKKILMALCLTFLAGMMIHCFGGETAYAAGLSSATAETLELDTWYVDECSTDETEWFKFKTGTSNTSQYIILIQIFGYPYTEEDPSVNPYVKLPGDTQYTSVDGKFMKLQASTTYRIKVKAFIYDMVGSDEEDYDWYLDGSVRYKIMVKEMKGASTSITPSYSKSSPKALELNKWYKIKSKYASVPTKTKHTYFKVTTTSRKNSRYIAVMYNELDDMHLTAMWRTGSDSVRAGSYDEKFYMPWMNNVLEAKNTNTLDIYYWLIKSDDFSEEDAELPATGTYKLFLLEMPDLPSKQSITSLYGGTKRFTVKFKSNSLKSRYQIAYKRTTSNTWKFVTTTETSKVVKGLTSGKKYHVKVRSQRLVDGKYHSGQWSKTRTVTAK